MLLHQLFIIFTINTFLNCQVISAFVETRIETCANPINIECSGETGQPRLIAILRSNASDDLKKSMLLNCQLQYGRCQVNNSKGGCIYIVHTCTENHNLVELTPETKVEHQIGSSFFYLTSKDYQKGQSQVAEDIECTISAESDTGVQLIVVIFEFSPFIDTKAYCFYVTPLKKICTGSGILPFSSDTFPPQQRKPWKFTFKLDPDVSTVPNVRFSFFFGALNIKYMNVTCEPTNYVPRSKIVSSSTSRSETDPNSTCIQKPQVFSESKNFKITIGVSAGFVLLLLIGLAIMTILFCKRQPDKATDTHKASNGVYLTPAGPHYENLTGSNNYDSILDYATAHESYLNKKVPNVHN